MSPRSTWRTSPAMRRRCSRRNTPKELILHFLHNVSDDELKKAWEEGFEHNAKEQLTALQERIDMLKSWMVDMKSGQRLTFLHKPGAGIQVEVNGTVKGTIDRKSTRLNSSHLGISYAVFCLKKK